MHVMLNKPYKLKKEKHASKRVNQSISQKVPTKMWDDIDGLKWYHRPNRQDYDSTKIISTNRTLLPKMWLLRISVT